MMPFLRRTAWRWAPAASSWPLQSDMSEQASHSEWLLSAAMLVMPCPVHEPAVALFTLFVPQEPFAPASMMVLEVPGVVAAVTAVSLKPQVPCADAVVAEALAALQAAAISGVHAAAISGEHAAFFAAFAAAFTADAD